MDDIIKIISKCTALQLQDGELAIESELVSEQSIVFSC